MRVLPKHVGVIMDGNRRWAKANGLATFDGHRRGVQALKQIIEACIEAGIPQLSAFAFSQDNWKRSANEIAAIFSLVEIFIQSELREFIKNGVRLQCIGNLRMLPPSVQESLAYAERQSRGGSKLTLCLAINYSGQWAIAQAVNKLLLKCEEDGSIPAFAPSDIASYMSTSDLSDLDIVIRTGGEQRLSNFYIWEAAYAELYFTPVLWPEFGKTEFRDALAWFESRERRFGGGLLA